MQRLHTNSYLRCAKFIRHYATQIQTCDYKNVKCLTVRHDSCYAVTFSIHYSYIKSHRKFAFVHSSFVSSFHHKSLSAAMPSSSKSVHDRSNRRSMWSQMQRRKVKKECCEKMMETFSVVSISISCMLNSVDIYVREDVTPFSKQSFRIGLHIYQICKCKHIPMPPKNERKI